MTRAFVKILIACALAAPWPIAAVASPAQPTHVRYRVEGALPQGEFDEERKLLDSAYHGTYGGERQALQDGIIRDTLGAGRKAPSPRIIFTAGPMGAGKGRSLQLLASQGHYDPRSFVVIDPDRIKERIPDYEELLKSEPLKASTLVHRESTTIEELAVARALSQGRNIVVDGSLKDGDFHEKRIAWIRKLFPHYSIELVEVDTREELARQRMLERAERTGRRPPEEVFEGSVKGARESIPRLKPLFDRALTIDNNGPGPVVVKDERPRAPDLPPKGGFRHVVFDLDWTLLSELTPGSTADPSRVIEIDGKRYFVSYGAEEAIAALAADPRVRISFFSGGSRTRNVLALKAIRLKDGSGRSLFDVAYRVLSAPDLSPVEGADPKARFNERFKKNLRKIARDIRNILLVDDIRNFARRKQHLLYLGRTYLAFDSFEDAERARAAVRSPEYVPPTEAEWLREKHKIPAVYAMIREALDGPSRGRKRSFARTAAGLATADWGGYATRGLAELGLPGCGDAHPLGRALGSIRRFDPAP